VPAGPHVPIGGCRSPTDIDTDGGGAITAEEGFAASSRQRLHTLHG
jgi:hypothetical protein